MTARRGRPTPHRFTGFQVAVAAVTFLLAAAHTPLNRAQEQPPPWVLCSPAPSSGSYLVNSMYQRNIRRLSATVPKAASSTEALYAKDSFGSVPDIVYAQALCRGDANASACDSCVATAFQGAQRECPLAKDVLIFYDLCQLRFSNRNFLLDDDYFVTTYYLQSSQNVTAVPAAEFDAAVRLLVNATAEHAVASPTKKFGTGVGGFGESNRPKIYALSQCAPDPDRALDVCRTCLATIIPQLPNYFSGMNGGGVFGVWCSFRYEVYPFFSGDPLLQLPAFVATPIAPSPSPVTAKQERSRKGTGTILAIVIPAVAAIVAITMVLCFWRSRSASQSVPPNSTSWQNDIESGDMLLVDLATLRVATDDFAESKMLGKGGFGTVYKGTLPQGQEIAVKRLCQTSRQGMEELKSELVLVAKLHHKNLVRIIGVCLQEHEKILVYEYMPNKSLDAILFDGDRNKELDWGKRFKIINGIAKGLQYLHEDSQLKIVHRDLKASNVLLDFDYLPKISDFGLAKIFGEDKSQYVTLRIAGTYGYMAPEYAMRGRYSIKSDVFSFGVLVLEIITGRRNSGSYSSDQDLDLLNLVWDKWNKGSIVELIDPSLRDHPPPVEQLMKCVHIGLLCVQGKPTARPVMSWVNIMLSSNTVRLPSLSRPAICVQEISDRESSDTHSATTWLQASRYTTNNNSEIMSCNEVSFTELSPR